MSTKAKSSLAKPTPTKAKLAKKNNPLSKINTPRMTTPNRTALLTKIHKVLKKHYKPVLAPKEPPVLDSLLLASCLENTRPAIAMSVLEALKKTFFDLNEIRVSTVKELAEVMQPLSNPSEAAARLKGILQSVFESEYAFDLESLKKQNLGVAIKRLQKLDGATPFIVAYTVQTALGGHSIPVDKGSLGVLFVLGAITETEARSGNPPGMERAIPKSKGQEFGSLLHQLGAEFTANPFALPLREFLLTIAPDAKERFPKRVVKKPEPPAPPVEPPGKKKPGHSAVRSGPADKTKDKPLSAVKKNPVGSKKPTEAPRHTDAGKKKLTSPKPKLALKPLAKRKPR
jgi:endonuclease III